MKLDGPIVVATALDEAGDEALRQAVALARRAEVRLVTCHVLPDLYGHHPLFPQLREEDRGVAEATRAAVSAELTKRTRAAEDGSGVAYEVRVEAGSPHTEVLRVADDVRAALVVVGAGSHGAGASLGGVAERIVRHAHSPVLVARPHAGSVVIAATDFSDPARPAVEAGRAEAKRRGARFVVVHAVEVTVLPMDSPESAPTIVVANLLDAEAERAEALMAEVAKAHGADETVVRVGPPDGTILDEAVRRSADLVVVGTHGRSGMGRLTLGSVAESVVRHAPCSVLVVRLAH